MQVCIADTIIALFAGLLIFPAVFTYHLEPTAGPPLIFISLPQVFLKMPGGRLFSILFFLLIIVAAITSMISMLEIMITFIEEKTKIKRQSATWLVVLITSIGGCINIAGEGPLSFIRFGGKTIFDSLDYLTNQELAEGGRPATLIDQFFNLLLKCIIPLVIFILMCSLLLGGQ